MVFTAPIRSISAGAFTGRTWARPASSSASESSARINRRKILRPDVVHYLDDEDVDMRPDPEVQGWFRCLRLCAAGVSSSWLRALSY